MTRSRPPSRRKVVAAVVLALFPIVVLAVVVTMAVSRNAQRAAAPGAQAPPSSPESAIARLAVDRPLAEYQQLLGPATLERPWDADAPAGSPAAGRRAVLWIRPSHAVTAIVDGDRVLGYSVTARTPSFSEPVPGTAARLHDTFAAAFPQRPALAASVDPPNGDWSYDEVAQAGPPGQPTVVLTDSVAGSPSSTGAFDTSTVDDVVGQVAPGGPPGGPLAPVVRDDPAYQALRGALTVTTYSVLGPSLPVGALADGVSFGPGKDDLAGR